MKIKDIYYREHHGTFDQIVNFLTKKGITITLLNESNGMETLRTNNGGIINFWGKSKKRTLQYQGVEEGKMQLMKIMRKFPSSYYLKK